MADADIFDEHGNRIQLTDELGNPVQLTDEHGRPMHLTGVAATSGEVDVVVVEAVVPAIGTHPLGVPPLSEGAVHGGATGIGTTGGEHRLGPQLRRSSSSSSSSSDEDDGQGGRRKKKKGLREKLKEILPGKHKDEHERAPQTTSAYPVPISSTTPPGVPRSSATHPSSTTPPGVPHSSATHPSHEHEKKGIIEKIKEKLPGTHHHNP